MEGEGEDRDRVEKFVGGCSSRRWSSLENLGCTVVNVQEDCYGRRIDGLSMEKSARIKEKGTIESLKSSLERKMGSVERILEDQMRRILEKDPGPRGVGSEEGRLNGRDKIQPSFDFKFIAAENENEDGKIECRLEHLRRPERSSFEGANLISRLKRCEHSKTEEEGVLEMKDAKHHVLFDRLRDNVKEKMEDIHRVYLSVSGGALMENDLQG